MPWKHNGKIIQENKTWISDSGVKHPAVWMRWSDSEKKDNGLTWEDPPVIENFDRRFYSAKDKERNLNDVNDVNPDDGKALIDPITKKQSVTLGLKSIHINETKERANTLLSKHDWMVTRKAEKGTAIPDDVTKYRDSVRTACNTIETKINNCSNMTEFMALFDVPVDSDKNPTGNEPINDWPDEI
tara:strand:- start:250 stop:807 length:558 start_codon:yes stop_codon:yes gene_type:complete